MTTWRRVEQVKTTIRYEFEAPVDRKTIGFAVAKVEQEFERLNGRKPDCDGGWWLVPTDEGIAIVFEVTAEREANDA